MSDPRDGVSAAETIKKMVLSCEWDGQPRLDSWLHFYYHATPTAYAHIGAMWLLSAVARAGTWIVELAEISTLHVEKP